MHSRSKWISKASVLFSLHTLYMVVSFSWFQLPYMQMDINISSYRPDFFTKFETVNLSVTKTIDIISLPNLVLLYQNTKLDSQSHFYFTSCSHPQPSTKSPLCLIIYIPSISQICFL